MEFYGQTLSKSEQSCIERILETDSRLGAIRNHECETKTLSTTIQNYVIALEALDFKDCPNNFEQAFQDHIQTWKNMTSVTDRHPHLRGEMHELFDQIKQTNDSTAFNTYLSQIWRTWDVIEKTFK